MSYLALYRKYRPKTFDGIIGQENIVKTLKNQVQENKVSHAYLFTGSRGTGKTSAAKILARAVNCLEPKKGSPCNNCEICKILENKGHLDILEIDAASNNKVEEVRDLREKIKYSPVNGKYKVYIIDEVHMLTDSAFNALLKTLEEPPEHAMFILATTEAHKMPATILSRTIRFDFKLVEPEKLVQQLKYVLKNEGISYDDEALKAIASAAEGSVRDALSIADMCIGHSQKKIDYDSVIKALGATSNKTIFDFVNSIIEKKFKDIILKLDEIVKSGKNLQVFAKDLTVYFRNLIVLKNIEDKKQLDKMLILPDEIYEKMLLQSEKETQENLILFMNNLSKSESDIRYSNNPKVILEATILDTIYDLENNKENLLKRIENLEKVIAAGPNVKKINSGNVKTQNIKKNDVKTVPSIDDNKKVPKKILKKESEKEFEKEIKTDNQSDINLSKSEGFKLLGKVVLNLRKANEDEIYKPLSNVEEIAVKKNKIIIFIKNPKDYNDLIKSSNFSIIEKQFEKEKEGVEVSLNLEKDIANMEKVENKLKNKLGEDLKVKPIK